MGERTLKALKYNKGIDNKDIFHLIPKWRIISCNKYTLNILFNSLLCYVYILFNPLLRKHIAQDILSSKPKLMLFSTR